MPKWLQILLAALGGFTTGAGAISQTVPNADTTAILVSGGIAAANTVVGLLVKSPLTPKREERLIP